MAEEGHQSRVGLSDPMGPFQLGIFHDAMFDSMVQGAGWMLVAWV